MRDLKHRRDVCPASPGCRRGWAKTSTTPCRCMKTSIFSLACSVTTKRSGVRIIEAADQHRVSTVSRSSGRKLSGRMKQKLGLCCALIHDPELLILDEPTTGVDPLSRSQFWDLIDSIRQRQSNMSVLVATAYMEEAGTLLRLRLW